MSGLDAPPRCAPSERHAFCFVNSTKVRSRLPLVSVIIVNFNYGRFLDEAVRSVYAQRYENVECVVVDNASTDETPDVLRDCAASFSSLKIIRNASNEGQTAACLRGLAASEGTHVIFLDADDYLLPDCIAAHMAVHLSSRVHVGFTCCDMLQLRCGETVVSTNEAPFTYILSKRGPDQALLRPSPSVLCDPPFVADDLTSAVYLIPRTQRHWVWAPMSGNCFRRDALELFCDGRDLAQLMSQTDLYLALGVNAACGSIHIDRPLFAYRLHGSNVFSSRPQLQGFLSFDAKRGGPQAALARRLIVDQLVRNVERFVERPERRWTYFRMLRQLDFRSDDPAARCASYAAHAIAQHYDALSRAVGGVFCAAFFLLIAPWSMKLRFLTRQLRLSPSNGMVGG